MLPPDFTHLHVHSHFSLLGGLASVEALVARAKADGFTRLALTDANALYGAVAFARACAAAGIAPILGMTVKVGGVNAGEPDVDGLVLLARNSQGYRSLCRIASAIQGDPQREQLVRTGVPWATVAENCAGLICLAGGQHGRLDRLVRAGRLDQAREQLQLLAGTFGDDTLLAMAPHVPAAVHHARALFDLAMTAGVAVAAVQPIYCLAPADRRLLQLLAAIERNCQLEAVSPADLPGGDDPAGEVHWPAPHRLETQYAGYPSALAATAAIARRCEPALPDGRPVWPVLPLPAEQSPVAALTVQAQAGMAARYGENQLVARRLAHELAAIEDRGFAPLFLLVADIVHFARRAAIPVSTRGSVANSLVAYCIGITTVDPVEHDLLFERFLNPAREGLPDIDLDFCSRRRDEVLDYVRQTYGVDRVALVATVSTLQPRSAVRETAKVYGLDDAATERLVRLLPDAWHPDPRRRTGSDVESIVARLNDPTERQAVRDAYLLVGQPDHLSVHPGGVVVTPGPVTDYAPVQLAPKGFLITQFAHEDVETIGLPKIDLLGIRALTVLNDGAVWVRRHYAPGFELAEISLADELTGDLLQRGDTIGVFQCESAGAQRTLRQLKARTVRDLAVANAFFKPGPATGGMAQHFIRRYRGEEPVAYLHPALEPILGRTRGVLLFQEQVLRVAVEIAGLSWAEADRLRKGMSKFQAQEMTALKDRFVTGCQRPPPGGVGFTPGQALTLWDQVAAFAGYGFNQGHATAYADVSYRSAYLRAHWPAAFLCARLADWGGFHHQAIYIAEARRLGCDVRPPHINHSAAQFTLETPGQGAAPILWMGLGQVRDLRQATVAAIQAARAVRPFGALADFTARVAVQPRELTNLIQCGALDGLGGSRAALLAGAAAVSKQSDQMSFDFFGAAADPVGAESAGERLAWELHVLGLPVSVHPLATVSLPAAVTSLAQAAATGGRLLHVAAVRLPGWTGGPGFFLGDTSGFLIATLPEKSARPPLWEPVQATGRWVPDEWGGGLLRLERCAPLATV